MNSVLFVFCFVFTTFVSLIFVVRVVGKRRLLRTRDAATLRNNVSFFSTKKKKKKNCVR